MQQSHGIGYAEYSQKLENRLAVERKRQREYEQSRRIVAEVDRIVHR